jgi:hypothetical protein
MYTWIIYYNIIYYFTKVVHVCTHDPHTCILHVHVFTKLRLKIVVVPLQIAVLFQVYMSLLFREKNIGRPRLLAGCGASPHFSNNLNKSKYSEIGLKYDKLCYIRPSQHVSPPETLKSPR